MLQRISREGFFLSLARLYLDWMRSHGVLFLFVLWRKSRWCWSGRKLGGPLSTSAPFRPPHTCLPICHMPPLITNPPQITCPWGWLEGELAARLANISWHRIKFLEGNLANRKRLNPEWDHKRKNVPLCSTLWTLQCLPKEELMRL